jgi:hypothetical protein
MSNYSQPGIINPLDYGLVANEISAAYTNVQALQSAIEAAQALCDQSGSQIYGGTIVIPSNNEVPNTVNGNGGLYYFATTSLGAAINITCPYPILILGTGGGTRLVMTTDNDLFEVNNVQSGETGASGGVTFQDLFIAYQTGLSNGAAIRVIGSSQNVRLLRVILNDCPVGVAFDESLQCSMIDCVVWNATNSGNAVTLGIATSGVFAKETYIAGCLFEASNAALGTGTGLTIVHVDEVRVANTRIEAYAQGIAIVPEVGDCVNLFFGNVTAIPFLTSSSSTGGAALLVQPPSSGGASGSVFRAVFVGCTFGQTKQPADDTMYTGPGVLIDQSQTSGVLEQVRFVSCWSSGWPGNGMQINGVVNQVEIIGGCYSCNGQASDAPSPSIGIAITNPSSDAHSGIRIIGAACNNSVYNNNGEDYLSATQDIGISIAAGATNVRVHQCDLTSNNTAGLVATTPDVTVHVTDCAGYNDQALTFSTLPGNGDTFQAQSDPYYYCGPIAFYVAGGSDVTISVDGNLLTGISLGGFTLNPGEYASLAWTAGHPPTTFYLVGK